MPRKQRKKVGRRRKEIKEGQKRRKEGRTEEGKGEKMRRNLREQGGKKRMGGDKGEND